MSETYPRKTLCETLCAGYTPSSVGFGCKGSELFWIEQIFLLKVCSLRVKGKESPNNIRQAPQNATSVFGDPAG